jgi:hypothetical protein
MPWQEMSSMDQRLQFITEHQRGLYAMTALCARNRISHKTGYKCCAHYTEDGPAGLLEHSRRPHASPGMTPATVVAALLALRARHHSRAGRSSSPC